MGQGGIDIFFKSMVIFIFMVVLKIEHGDHQSILMLNLGVGIVSTVTLLALVVWDLTSGHQVIFTIMVMVVMIMMVMMVMVVMVRMVVIMTTRVL